MLLLVTATAQEMRAALGGLHGPSRAEPSTYAADNEAPGSDQGEVRLWEHADLALLTLVTGVGVINTSLTLGRVLNDYPLTGVLNLGLAGSFDLETLPLCSICAAASESWPEFGLGTHEGVDVRALKFPLHERDGLRVWNRLDLSPRSSAERMELELPSQWSVVHSLTVSTVSGTPAQAGELVASHPAGMENMEGFAVAYACHVHQTPLLEVRAISNLVGSREKAHWDIRGGMAALGHAAAGLLHQGSDS